VAGWRIFHQMTLPNTDWTRRRDEW
jgi:hypothetical protein